MTIKKLNALLCSFFVALCLSLPFCGIIAWADDTVDIQSEEAPAPEAQKDVNESAESAADIQEIPDEHLLPRFTDDANLLTAEEAATLQTHLDELSNQLSFDIVIHTTNSLDGQNITSYADDFYDYNGYGIGTNHDGVILVIAMDTRDWYISSTGEGIDIFSDEDIQNMGDLIVEDLGNANYFNAFMTFADQTKNYVAQARNNATHDAENLPRDQFKPESLAYGAILGFIIALILALYKKSQLKSVELREDAHEYARMETLSITQRHEHFLHTSIATVDLSSESNDGSGSTHIGSSGTSHGGGGGKF